MNPLLLNAISNIPGFPNTWSRYDRNIEINGITKIQNFNPGVEYFRLAFHPKEQWSETINLELVKNPVAIQTTYYDLRMYSQRSCFTIHGTDEMDLETFASSIEANTIMFKYKIPPEQCERMLEELHNLGINEATIFPDMTGLAYKLSNRFKNN